MLQAAPERPGPVGIVGDVHILLATDAPWIVDEVTAALGGPETSFTVCREGRKVAGIVADRTPDLVIADLQVGSMGGMAISMAMRLDESAGTLPHVPILMLVDRRSDAFLAHRSGTDGWIVKPLDALRLQRAVRAIVDGGRFTDGLPDPRTPAGADDEDDGGTDADAADDEAPAEEVAPSGG